MSVPGRVDAAAILLSVGPRPKLVRHSRAVAEVAGWLAARIERAGVPIDRRIVEAAALLHDVDKGLPRDDPAKRLAHGQGSAAWLTRQGYPELASAVANHPVTRLLDGGEAPDTGAAFQYGSWEERVVAYADKRARQTLLPMDQRFAIWRQRYPVGSDDHWTASSVVEITARAKALEAEVCRAAGVQPHEVRRLRWTARALELAEDSRSGKRRPGRA